jgi:UDP-N-acetylmuramoylalanine--D-glutamate ligase
MTKIAILGAGVSGVGAARLAIKEGYEPFVSDAGPIKEHWKQELTELHVPFEEEGHNEGIILACSEIVKSPGIPDSAPLLVKAREKNIPIISEIEFAARHTAARIVAITGSNGKTTTTALTYHILKEGGLNVGLAGNIGHSFAGLVATEDHDCYVLEVSSFQLDGIQSFKPEVSVLLNITPDHLDRYDNSLDAYAASKFRIAMNQTSSDHFIYNSDDTMITERLTAQQITAQMLPISQSESVEEGACIDQDRIQFNLKKTPFDMFIYELALQGKHNLYNSMAAGIVANIFDLRKDQIRESLKSFENLEHRLEFVNKIQGIDFINDSKATNVNSAWYALETMDKPIVWIAGGTDKGNDYEALIPLVQDKVKAIVCLGLDNRKIHDAFSKYVELIVNTVDMAEAVKLAYHFADNEDVVLLSPSCASFDLFENYEDRGRQFKNAVKNL